MRILFARVPLVRACAVFALAAAAVACGAPPPSKGPVGRRRPALEVQAPPPAKSAVEASLPAHLLAELDDGHVAAYFARRDGQGLLLYGSRAKWLTRAVGPGGAPLSAQPIDVGPHAAEVPLAALSPAGDGYIAAWIERVNGNDAVKMLVLDAAGHARGAPAHVTQSADALAWIDILPNAKGVLILWDIPRGDVADVVFVPIAADGKVLSSPARATRETILGWSALGTPSGAVFAFVSPVQGSSSKDAAGAELEQKLGRVLLVEVDAAGKVGAPIVVSGEPTAQADVEVATAGSRYVLAWTDQKNIDASVHVAAVEPGGKVVVAPRRAMAPSGEQALVGLVAAPFLSKAALDKHALLAWEDLYAAGREDRLIHLGLLGADAALGAERATLVLSSDTGPPDLVADGDGFAAVTLAPLAPEALGAAGADCRGADCLRVKAPGEADVAVVPAYVRFGPDLNVLASAPVRADVFGADRQGAPYLTRGLSCSGGSCLLLASGAGARPPLALVALPAQKSRWRAPAWREPDDKPPRAAALTGLYDGDRISKIVAADVSAGASLVAWVTYFLEGSSGDATERSKTAGETGATLALRAVSAAGEPGPPVILSGRALSIGGIGIASAPPAPEARPGAKGKGRETAIAWAARERGEPQVFVTKVGEDGKKLAQKTVTVVARKRKAGIPSEVYDAAIAYAPATGEPAQGQTGDGWIVAWVDTRDQNAEIYVAKIDRSLKKIIPDRRITTAPGDSVEVQIAVRGKDTFLVWSDARENPDAGNGDIYLIRLDTRTLDKRGEETRLFASPVHSRSPVVAPAAQGMWAAWIEETVGGPKQAAGDDGLGLRIAELDDKGQLAGLPRLVRGERDSAVTSVAIGCEANACRGALTSALGENMVLSAFTFAPRTGASPLKTLALLSGGAGADTSLGFSSGSARSLFFADDSRTKVGRVRFMTIEWP